MFSVQVTAPSALSHARPFPAQQPLDGSKTRAVVLGGGMAGLAATRTLADVFDEVILLERDDIGDHEVTKRRPVLLQGFPPPSVVIDVSIASVVRQMLLLLQEPPTKRGGVAQYFMPHVMLVGGLEHCEELFPDFRGNLQHAGGQEVDWLKQCSVVCCHTPFAVCPIPCIIYQLRPSICTSSCKVTHRC